MNQGRIFEFQEAVLMKNRVVGFNSGRNVSLKEWSYNVSKVECTDGSYVSGEEDATLKTEKGLRPWFPAAYIHLQ
jgi:hypothetical protein